MVLAPAIRPLHCHGSRDLGFLGQAVAGDVSSLTEPSQPDPCRGKSQSESCLYTPPAALGSLTALMTLDEILLEAEEKMEKTEQVVINEFSGVRTGKASASLVENIMVDVYGSNMRL